MLCASLDGTVLARATAAGASPEHNSDAIATIRTALRDALATAKATPDRVAACVAGIAGLNDESDRVWAEEAIDLGFLRARAVNDADVALAGAFRGQPGIVAICGTGSTVTARNAHGLRVRNDWYHHWAGAARTLGYRVVQDVAREANVSADAPLVRAVLDEWSVADAADLRARLRDLRSEPDELVKRRFASLASVVTATADRSPIAAAACDELARELVRGIDLVAVDLDAEHRRVALVGSVARSPAITSRVDRLLASAALHEPESDPVAGAVLLAIEDAGGSITDGVVTRLGEPS